MKTLAIAAAVTTLLVATSPGAQQPHHHVTAADLKWSPVASLPPGAEVATLEGSMSAAAPFTVRLKLPANYRVPAHTHPAVERVTVLSGTFHMGMGDKLDTAQTHPVKAGELMIMQPGTAHFGWTEVETIVQLHGSGPWAVVYVNPADDPRRK